MFTGIVKGRYEVVALTKKENMTQFAVKLDSKLLEGIEIGASVAVDGVCLTVVKVDGVVLSFDVIAETLQRSTLKELSLGQMVNIERSLRMGDEIGGHILSGHVMGEAVLRDLKLSENNHVCVFDCNPDWMRYIISKGFIALDGASLTVGQVDPKGSFTVHLIPETLRLTSFGTKEPGAKFNLEIDPQTQAIVHTVERVLAERT